MPDTLAPLLTEPERKATADRLWKVIEMIDAGRPPSEIREATVFTVRQIEPFNAQYQEKRQ